MGHQKHNDNFVSREKPSCVNIDVIEFQPPITTSTCVNITTVLASKNRLKDERKIPIIGNDASWGGGIITPVNDLQSFPEFNYLRDQSFILYDYMDQQMGVTQHGS